MYFLSVRYLNCVTIRNYLCLLSSIFLFACSTTKHISTQNYSENNYYIDDYSYSNVEFYNRKLTDMNQNTQQSIPHSDHHLMMALLNRPVTADQAMMIAFEQERINYTGAFANYGVEIKGNKHNNKVGYRANNLYSDLILHDINAVNITAPH